MQLPPVGSPLEEDDAALAQIPKVRIRTPVQNSVIKSQETPFPLSPPHFILYIYLYFTRTFAFFVVARFLARSVVYTSVLYGFNTAVFLT